MNRPLCSILGKPFVLLFSFITLLFLASPAEGQWIERIEYLDMPFGSAIDIAVGPLGIYTTGYGSSGAFWARHSRDGNIEATFEWKGVSGLTVATDSRGNSYLSAQKGSKSLIDLDPSPAIDTVSSRGIILAKFDEQNELVWSRVLEYLGTENEISSAIIGAIIAVDSVGNLYAAINNVRGTIDVDPGPDQMIFRENEGRNKLILAKYSLSGDLLWAFSLLGAKRYQLEIDSQGRPTIMGLTYLLEGETIDFDPSEEVQGLAHSGLFIATYTSEGQFVRVYGTEGGSINFFVPPHMSLSGDGQVYVAGYFNGTVDFAPGASTAELSTSGADGFVARYDTTGTLQWVRKLEDGTNNHLDAIYPLVGQQGDLFLAGHFFFDIDFDWGPGTFRLYSAGNGLVNGFLAAYDASGEFRTANVFGGSDGAEVYGVAADESGFVYLVGRDFYTNPFTGAESDEAFLIKASGYEEIPLRNEPEEGTPESEWEVSLYPNPASFAATCEIRLASHEPVRIRITDLLGRSVREMDAGVLAAGTHHVDLDLSNLAAGQYFVVVTTGDNHKALGLSLVR